MSTRLKETIINVASYYGRTISAPVLAMYAEDLADLPEDEVISAYTAYRRNPKNTQFPLPAQIRGVVSPAIDPDSAAREIASRINHAVVKFGWANAPEAHSYIGELGWDIVNRSGGWSYICQNLGVQLDPGVFSAQVRELAKSSITHDSQALANVIGLASAGLKLLDEGQT